MYVRSTSPFTVHSPQSTAEAREALQVLDDALKEKHEVRDIVDTVVYDGQAVSAEQILKVLLGGIQKHLDERDVPRAREHSGFV
jgi:hypothetical protein